MDGRQRHNRSHHGTSAAPTWGDLHRGASLLEVLISVVVLSIGMLGVASLQLNVSRYNHSAGLRAVATHQAYNMLDRIRANKVGAENGNYDNLAGIPASPTSCTPCSPSQIATKDLAEWNTENALWLPSGQGTIHADSGVYTVSIYWDNNRTGAAGLDCGADLTVDLSCIQISAEL